MKKILILICASTMLVGCASTFKQTPPTATELKFFTVQTNIVISLATNTVTVTNDQGVVTPTQQVTPTPHEVYTFTPNNATNAIQQIGGEIGGFFGVGGTVSTILGGLIAMYASWRSRQRASISNNLIQAIETARSVILTLPNGQQYDQQFILWLQKHQAEAGLVQKISTLVADVSDAPAADDAAAVIDRLVKESK